MLAALLVLLICATALAAPEKGSEAEATTAITLPVDSVTIYPDGLMAVKRTGSLDVTAGEHKYVMNVPKSADKSTVLLSVSNSTVERVVYEGNPVYTLNISSAGSQKFDLSYLMFDAGSWEPMYNLHLANDSILIKANAVVRNKGGEDLNEVRLKLVAGLPPSVEPYFAMKTVQALRSNEVADAAPSVAYAAAPAPAPSPATSALETLYIFELEGRKDLEMDKEIGLPLFEETAPLVRMYTWDAYSDENGPAVEEIRANNTLHLPWPSGGALLYRDDDYISSIVMPYTPTGTNASIVVGPSSDLKVSKKLLGYNITEKIKVIRGSENQTNAVKETTENSTYELDVESNIDRRANVEVTDTRPKESKIVAISPEPSESTATGLKWKLSLLPREKKMLKYTHQVVTTESLDRSN
ncbi:MAG: hypothetical protein A4E48_00181 [Methanosaeta sp. PtaU1.Bin060]|nr:MAG: hypothetical protein A4E48_00181 [Methanosaeta sp. PtaU1.Bin060]